MTLAPDDKDDATRTKAILLLIGALQMPATIHNTPVCVCVCVRSHFASKAARRQHQSVLLAALVNLFGVSPCLEAPSGKGQAEVEEAASEALPGSLFLLVRASQFCVAPSFDQAGSKQRRRLDPTTTGDWESKVLGSGNYSGVLPHDQVPFVNRRSEVFDLSM